MDYRCLGSIFFGPSMGSQSDITRPPHGLAGRRGDLARPPADLLEPAPEPGEGLRALGLRDTAGLLDHRVVA